MAVLRGRRLAACMLGAAACAGGLAVAQSTGAAAGANVVSAAPVGPLLLSVEGDGVQVYRCSMVGGTAGWVVDHPDAELHAEDGKVVGRHFAGPTWKYKDGSEVVGLVVAHSPGKERGDAPWLRLQAVQHHGKGLLSQVATIERTATEGGGAPPMGCDAASAGRTQIVPYKARYTFYGER